MDLTHAPMMNVASGSVSRKANKEESCAEETGRDESRVRKNADKKKSQTTQQHHVTLAVGFVTEFFTCTKHKRTLHCRGHL